MLQILRFYAAEWHRKTELLPRYLTESQAQDLQRISDECLLAYAILSNMAVEAGVLLFPIRPKLHVSQLKGFGVQVLGNMQLPY